MSIRYMPIVADKQAELHALASLPARHRERLTPLIDLRNPVRPEKAPAHWSPEATLSRRLDDANSGVMGCWGVDDEVLIDGRRLDPRNFDTSVHPVDLAMRKCIDVGIQGVPVTGRDRDHAYREAVARWVRRTDGRAAIRLRDHDLFAGTDGVSVLLRELDVPKSSVDLILDLQHIDPNATFMVCSTTLACLQRLMPLSGWRTVTIAAGSFPQALSAVMGYNDLAIFTRAEQALFPQLVSGLAGGSLTFSDYGVLWSGDADETGHPGSANIRYANDRTWLVKRGLSRDKAASDDYARLAGELVGSDAWMGDEHCCGCAFLAAKARAGRGGSSTQYRQAGFEHHFAVVLNQLAA